MKEENNMEQKKNYMRDMAKKKREKNNVCNASIEECRTGK